MKLAQEMEEKERGKRKRPHWNRQTLAAAAKGILAAGAGMAAAVPVSAGIRWGLNKLDWPKGAKTKTLVSAAGGLGTAIPVGYALMKQFGQEHIEDAYQRSQEQPTGALRVG